MSYKWHIICLSNESRRAQDCSYAGGDGIIALYPECNSKKSSDQTLATLKENILLQIFTAVMMADENWTSTASSMARRSGNFILALEIESEISLHKLYSVHSSDRKATEPVC